jgi:cellobiose phosphorylase
MGKYGYFDDKNRAYVITRPDTPAPWINYLTNANYHALVSNTGGGFSFDRSPKDSRLIRFRYNSFPMDRPGRYVYIRDAETGEYWSPTWQPTLTHLDSYKCTHRPGVTTIESTYKGIYARIEYLVPLEGDFEYWRVSVKNEGKKTRKLSLFPYCELCLSHALIDLISQPNDQHFNHLRFDKADNSIYATKRYWSAQSGVTVKQANEAWDRMLFFTSTQKVKAFDGKLLDFFGKYRSEQNPINIEKGKLTNTIVDAGDACAALQHDINLGAGESVEFLVMLGVVPVEGWQKNAKTLFKNFRSLETYENEKAKVIAWFEEYFSAVQVNTPDKDMNRMLNTWNQLQALMTYRESRNASYYHGGLLYGTGMRDLGQDLLGPVVTKPEYARRSVIELCAHQFKDGSTLHNFFRVGGGGEKTNHGDTPVWLPMGIFFYIKETGDLTILEEKVPYYDEGEDTVLTHICGAIDYLFKQRTKRGLSKILNGDWNDDLDYLGRAGKGESLMISQQLAYDCKEASELFTFLGNQKKAEKYKKMFKELKEAINKHGWDGGWYIRATHDSGLPIGSKKCKQGKIFINSQSWAVIGGVTGEKRGIQCMNALRKYLDTPKGPKKNDPAYTKVIQDGYPPFGLITRECPGKKENASIFNHTVSWAILAEALLGRGEMAFDYYHKSLPMHLPPGGEDRYKMEPYVYAEYVTSTDHFSFGESSHAWLTGTAAWMFRDAVDYILGVRPEYGGLKIDPCIPKKWKKYSIHRRFRGVNYEITVKNPKGKNKGVKEIELDGKPFKGTLLPVFAEGETHTVEVLMG